MQGLKEIKDLVMTLVSETATARSAEARNRYPIIGSGTYGTYGTRWTGVP